MFSQDDFIAASRDFVCVRLESYESEEHQQLVRNFLRGAFANTAFCILAPDGKTRLSGSGRSPSALLGRRGGPVGDKGAVIRAMEEISSDYTVNGSLSDAHIQDFHTIRQAINVASGDQRLLLLTVTGERNKLSAVLQETLNEPKMIGRFHHDFAEKTDEQNWSDLIEKAKGESGFLIIQADSFGLKGTVVSQLPLSASAEQLKSSLTKANTVFAQSEVRKVYGKHLQEGRRKGIHFEGGMPYGEDRDGDGVIDERRGRR